MSRPRLFAMLLLTTVWSVALLMPVPQSSAERTLGSSFGVFLFGKGLHVTAYAVLAVVGGRVAGRWWPVPVGLLGHAALTEAVQPSFGRGGSVRDVGLDAAGIAVGTLVGWAWRRFRSTRSDSGHDTQTPMTNIVDRTKI